MGLVFWERNKAFEWGSELHLVIFRFMGMMVMMNDAPT